MLVHVLPLAAVLLGAWLLHRGLGARGLSPPERLALAAGAALITLASVSLAASRIEVFHPWVSASGTTALLALAGLALRKRKDDPAAAAASDRAAGAGQPPPGSLRREMLLFLSLVGGCGLLYGLFPTYFLLGWQDPGLYLAFAAHIARTGGLVLDLPVLRELHAAFGDAIALGYPGVYSGLRVGLSRDAAELIPQSVHLFPALIANAWAPFGVEGLVRANALVAAVGLALFYAFARRLLGPAWALYATILLGLNPALVWHARLSVTEPLLLVLTFAGLLCLLLASDLGSTGLAIAGGAALGLGVFDRLDAAIGVVAVAGAAIGSRRPAALAGYVPAAALGFLDAYLHSRPYLKAAWDAGAVKGLAGLNAAAIVLTLGRGRAAHGAAQLRRPVAVLLGLGLLTWLLYSFLWRWVSDESFTSRALLELAWYVTPLVLLLGVVGVVWAAWSEPWERWLGWILLAALTLFVFSWQLLIDPFHPWAARRWIAQVFPALCLFATYALARVWRVAHRRGAPGGAAAAGDARARSAQRAVGRKGKRSHSDRSSGRAGELARPVSGRMLRTAAAVAVAAVGLAYVVNALAFARPFLFRSLLAGLPAGYRSLAAQLDPSRTYLSWSVHSASILTYVYDRPTVRVERYAPGMERYPIVGAPPGKLWGPALLLRQEGWANLCGSYVEEVEGARPSRVAQRCYDASPFTIGVLPLEEGRPAPGPQVALRAGSAVFEHDVGEIAGEGRLRATGAAGWLVRGPGVAMPAGRYRAVWTGTSEGMAGAVAPARFTVRTRGGPPGQGGPPEVERDLAEARLEPGVVGPFTVELDFALAGPAEGVEFPVRVEEGARLELRDFALAPAGPARESDQRGPER